jgi:RimJ/RimL family protein N-acetyltransferase
MQYSQNSIFMEPLATFQDKKHQTVIVTKLVESDADDLLAYANELIAEDTFILLSGLPLTKAYEEIYVQEAIRLMGENKKIHLLARIDGKIVSSFEVRRYMLRKEHVGEVGISVAKQFRDSGIGKKCLQILIENAKKMGLRMLVLTCFAINSRAIGLYESVGFQKSGVIPDMLLYKGNYEDEVKMYLPLV